MENALNYDGIEKLDLLYEGKAKKVFNTSESDFVIVFFKDDATANNGLKKGTINQKGIINNKMSNNLFKLLEENGIPTHFVAQLSDREALVKKVSIIPVEVIVRNVAAGSLSKKLGIAEGVPLSSTVIEYCYKDDSLGDPMINESHACALGISNRDELNVVSSLALNINTVLSAFFRKRGILLVDFKLEFGRLNNNDIVLADEISPDTCRLWDIATNEKLDKDRFRRDLGGVEEAYVHVFDKLFAE